MKFNRKELRAAVQRAIEEHGKAHKARVDEYQAGLKRNRDQWHEAYAAEWREFAKTITAKLKARKGIEESDMPRAAERYRGFPFFCPHFAINEHGRHLVDPGPYPGAHAELLNLLAILDASTDDEITSSSLRDMGFGSLRHVVQYMRPKENTK